MKRPRLLDLFCGAGGCAKGYHDAGFDVVGVDIEQQQHYPFPFEQGDAILKLGNLLDSGFVYPNGKPLRLEDFAAIHASPPCQGYSRMRHLPWLKGRTYPMLVAKCLILLDRIGLPYVVENVEDCRDIGHSIMLCGTMFGLKVYRHRLFASNQWLWQPHHDKHKEVIGKGRMLNDRANANANGFVSLPSKVNLFAGRQSGSCGPTDQVSNRNYHSDGSTVMTVGGHNFKTGAASIAMGIDWMNRAELAQAIPPAYTEYIGKQLIRAIG